MTYPVDYLISDLIRTERGEDVVVLIGDRRFLVVPGVFRDQGQVVLPTKEIAS